MRGDGPRSQFIHALEAWRSERVANHNYTVWFSDDSLKFQRLQWGGCTVVRTRDPERFGRALALHFGGHGAPPSGLLRTEGVVAIRDGRATVLPASLRQSLDRFERPLREGGVILHDAPWVDLDPLAGEVVLEPPRLPPARFGEVVDGLPPARRPDSTAEPGRYTLAGWYFASIRGKRSMSSVDAVMTVLSRMRWPLHEDDQLPALRAMFERIPFDRLPLTNPRELLDQVRP